MASKALVRKERKRHPTTKLHSLVGTRFRVRAFAFIVDNIVFYTLWYASVVLSSAIMGLVLGRSYTLDTNALEDWSLFSTVVLSIFYFAIFEWLDGATPGKLAFGLRVVQMNGEPCDFGAAVVRAVARYIDGFLLGLPAYVRMRAPLYQRIGDTLAKTIVVRSHSLGFRQSPSPWRFVIAGTISSALVIVSVVTLLAVSL